MTRMRRLALAAALCATGAQAPTAKADLDSVQRAVHA